MSEQVFVLAGKAKAIFALLRLAAVNHGSKTLKDLQEVKA